MRAAAVALLLAAFLAGCGGSTAASAGDAVKRQFAEVNAGQWGKEWDELHPGQQALVPRQKYIDCAPASHRVPAVRVLKEYDDPIAYTGVPETTGRGVTVQLGAEQETFYEVKVGGAWRWVLPNAAVAAYQAGTCPA